MAAYQEDYFFGNRDRVNHETKGLGSVRCDPAKEDLIVDNENMVVINDGVQMVYVVWDDDRLPVEKVPCFELEKLSDAGMAISSGF